MISIPYIDLPSQWKHERADLLPIIDSVLGSGQYIGGEQVASLEAELAAFCSAKHVVALNSGTDALVYGLLALGVGPGDEVITPPNSFVASTAAIMHTGAKPVFVDVLPDQNIDPEQIEKSITPATKAIMPVHLTGRPAAMKEILQIATRYSIHVIEDAAQSIGSKYNDKYCGTMGTVGCFSAHPLKNLNACGDGGFLITEDAGVYEYVLSIRNHGLKDRNTVERFGYVSRMDALQAAILRYRLKGLPDLIDRRRRNAEIYRDLLNTRHVFIPEDKSTEFNTYHTFVVQLDHRDELREHLLGLGIETSIHYPVPIHLQPASQMLGHKAGDFPSVEEQSRRILTLPIHQYLEENDLQRIANAINSFYK